MATIAQARTSTEIGNGLLRDVLVEHGYFDRWPAVSRVWATIRFGGMAFASRWRFGNHVARRVSVSTRHPQVTFHDYGARGRTGLFTPSYVAISDADGRVAADRREPRRYFDSMRRQLYWDRLDLLYFCGYACWNYLTSPFLLAMPGVVAREIGPWREGDECFRRLHVTFPPDFPTHSREQRFYFDERLRLRRLDYDPVVFASWARAAQYCAAHERFGDFEVATRRRVYPRRSDGRAARAPVLVWIELSDVRFE
jgi:hypothetical protein